MKRKAVQGLSLLLIVVVMLFSSFPTVSLSTDKTNPQNITVDCEHPGATGAAGYGPDGKFLAPIETPDPNAIKIYTVWQLNDVWENLAGSYVLMNDIDLSDFNGGCWIPIGNYNNPFTGIFDGQGHAIKNLNTTDDDYHYYDVDYGLFSILSGMAVVKNVGMESTYINLAIPPLNGAVAGAICGLSSDFSRILNCYNTGDIYGVVAGGICGEAQGSGLISNCYNTGTVSADNTGFWLHSSAGGICGEICDISSISSCYNAGAVAASVNSDHSPFAGGICGWNNSNNAPISNCYNIGNISAFGGSGASNAGGICGYAYFRNSGLISNCYDAGIIYASGSSLVYSGGICGYNTGLVTITNCVALSQKIQADASKPANNHSSLISYYGSNSNNLALSGISVNVNDSATRRISWAEAIGKATYEALGWDFASVWRMVPGYDYPQFWRYLDGNADLISLCVSPGGLDQDLSPDRINYTASVPYDVKEITITATADHPKASISGAANDTWHLGVGFNYFTVTVTAEDGTKKTYTIAVTRENILDPSDATLASLTLLEGEWGEWVDLEPFFDPFSFEYNTFVPFDVNSVTITANANNPAATVAGDGLQCLEVGDNHFNITVTAKDGTTKNYTIVVTRKPQLQLIYLIPDVGTLTPSFDPDITAYTVSVEGDVSSISFTAFVGGSNISIGFSEGGAYQDGNQWMSDPFGLDTAEKQITVYVYQDWFSQVSYSVTVIRDIAFMPTPTYIWEAIGNIGSIGRVIFDIPTDSDFLENYALVCDENIEVEIYFSPKRTENVIAAGQNIYVFAVRLPNGETREDISFSFKPIGGAVEKNKVIIYGDINEDGFVTTTDATLVTRWAGGNTAAVLRNILAADVNGDAYITTTDATLITRRAGGNAATVFSIEMKF